MVRVLGFDPGDKYTGWGLLIDGEPQFAGVLTDWSKLRELVRRCNPHYVVVERFLLYPRKARAQGGSTMVTSRVIGMIQLICKEFEIPMHEQQASRIRHDPLVKGVTFHRSPHANDALKHALAFWYREFTDAYKAPRHIGEQQNTHT